MFFLRNKVAQIKAVLVASVICLFILLILGDGTSLPQVDNAYVKSSNAANDLSIEPKNEGIAQSVAAVPLKATSNPIEQVVSNIVSPNHAIIHAEQAALMAADKAQKERRFVKGTEETNLLAPFQSEMKRQKDALSLEMSAIADSMPTPIVQLDVPLQYQNPSLPNGCEVTSLAMVLNFYGFDISNTTLSDSFLPKTSFLYRNKKRYSSSPDIAFSGEPRKLKSSFYCFINPLIVTTNDYFQSISESSLIPMDITGADEQSLVNELDSGNPVILIATLSFGKPMLYAPARWIVADTGEIYTPYLNLHCVVLCGYDKENFYLADPIEGNVICKRSTLMNSYIEMGSRAMTFHENP